MTRINHTALKYLSALMLTTPLLAGCNHNDDEPLEIKLNIHETYLPVNYEFSLADEDAKNLVKGWDNKTVIVNSSDELPDDPIGFSASYRKINFTDQTLLVRYLVHDYNVVSHSNRFFRETATDTYNWSLNLGISGSINDDEMHPEKMLLSRYAILVKKLPEDATVKYSFGITDKDYDWSKTPSLKN